MPRPALEVQDIFRDHGPGFRRARAGRLSLGQLKVMSAIECCRTAALGGHVAACEDCGQNHIAYNSCRNRHCPKCQGQVAREWLAAREAELLSVPYYHLVFTLPAAIADIAYQNKSVIYDILFKASAETMLTIAADPKHLGAKIGITAVLHTWGSAMTHHPHIHMIVPGGGISPDGSSWISCRPGFFLPVRVLSRLFRRLFIEKLLAAHEAGRLKFFTDHTSLAEPAAEFEGGDPLLRLGHVIDRREPQGQRQLGRVEERAGGQRDLMTAGGALVEFSPGDLAMARGAASGAGESLRPAPAEQGLATLLLATVQLTKTRFAEPLLELNLVAWHCEPPEKPPFVHDLYHINPAE